MNRHQLKTERRRGIPAESDSSASPPSDFDVEEEEEDKLNSMKTQSQTKQQSKLKPDDMLVTKIK